MDPRRVVEQAFPGQRVTAIKRIPRGNRKTTFSVEFGTRSPVVIQLSTDIEAIRSEAVITAAISKTTSVPVPTVLGGGVIDDTAYMLTARSDGENLHEQFTKLPEKSRIEVARTFGQTLGEIHTAIGFERCGNVHPADQRWQTSKWPIDTSATSVEVPDGVSSTRWFEQYSADTLDRLPPAFDSQTERIRALVSDQIVREKADGWNVTPVLFPWDLRPGNALFGDDGVAVMLDWEVPMAAPIPLAVAKVEYLVVDWYIENPDEERAAFRAGYESVRPYPQIDPVYRLMAIAATAIDSTGMVTNPMYPQLDRDRAIEFHQRNLEQNLSATDQ